LGDPDALLDGHGWPVQERLLEHERAETLRRCMAELEERAAALVRARLAGEDYTDVCRQFGLEAQQAHRLFHRAKNRLKTCVERARR
jgi:DNA-directed RNA polymerase specialized sigma24 family protein